MEISGNKKVGDEMELTFEGNTKKYTVVGLADEMVIDHELSHFAFNDGRDVKLSGITYLDSNSLQSDDIVNASVLTYNIKQIYETAESLENRLKLYEIENISKITKINTDKLENTNRPEWFQDFLDDSGINESILEYSNISQDKIRYNEDLLKCIGIYRGDNSSYQTFLFIEIIFVLVLTFAGIALIFTAFKITYRERIRDLEMLSSIGMSKSQIRKMCLKEGFIIATVRINGWYKFGVHFITTYNPYPSRYNT